MAKNYDRDQAIRELEKDNVISSQTAQKFTLGANRMVKVPSLEKVKGDPVFLCILIDGSGSMSACQDIVVQNHPIMLDALRGSAHARNNLLFVLQYLFNTSVVKLHPFTPLATAPGGDSVTVLNKANYTPEGKTALYQTLQSSLQDLLVTMSHARNEGLAPCCSVALVTDGEDTEGGASPADIQNLLQELRDKEILKSSVLVGLLNNILTKECLEKIQKELGFGSLINCRQNSAREIRQAFIMASQSVVAGLA